MVNFWVQTYLHNKPTVHKTKQEATEYANSRTICVKDTFEVRKVTSAENDWLSK